MRLSPGNANFLINCGFIGAKSNLQYPSTNDCMVACYPPTYDLVTDQILHAGLLTQALLRNMLENSYLWEKIQICFYQQIA